MNSIQRVHMAIMGQSALPGRFISAIESTGYQWINTGLLNTGDYAFEDTFLVKSITTPFGDGNWIIGARINPSHALGAFIGTSGFFNAYGGTTRSYPANFTANQWVRLEFSRTLCATTVIDTGSRRTYAVSGGVLIPEAYETDILLGKINTNYAGTGPDPRNLVGLRSGTIIKDSTTSELVRDYKPFLHNDGSVGMWDAVQKKFYGSAGSQNFIAVF